MSSQSPTPTRREQVARRVSMVFHPFIVAPLAIVLVLRLDGVSLWSALAWSAICAMLVVLPAVVYLTYKLARHQYTDADISVREHRYGMYAFGSVCMALCFLTLLWLEAPEPLLAILGAGLLTTITFGVMTRFWTKVSVHAGVVSMATVAVSFYSWWLGIIFALCAFAVSWSRLVLRRHTLGEILLGWMVACLLSSFIFMVF